MCKVSNTEAWDGGNGSPRVCYKVEAGKQFEDVGFCFCCTMRTYAKQDMFVCRSTSCALRFRSAWLPYACACRAFAALSRCSEVGDEEACCANATARPGRYGPSLPWHSKHRVGPWNFSQKLGAQIPTCVFNYPSKHRLNATNSVGALLVAGYAFLARTICNKEDRLRAAVDVVVKGADVGGLQVFFE